MTGEASVFTLLLIVLAAVAIYSTIWWAERGTRRYGIEERSLRCPETGEHVEITMARDLETGEYTGVHRCEGLPDPEDVNCRMACVDEPSSALDRAA